MSAIVRERPPKIGFDPSTVVRLVELIGEYWLSRHPQDGKSTLEAGFELSYFLRRAEGKYPQLELRKVEGEVVHLAVSLGSAGEQDAFIGFWEREGRELALKARCTRGGRTTVELGAPGVSKATLIAYLKEPTH